MPRVIAVRNHTLREMVVGLTHLTVEQLQAFHLRKRPFELVHWRFGPHRIEYTEVAAAADVLEAHAILAGHVSLVKQSGWVASAIILTE